MREEGRVARLDDTPASDAKPHRHQVPASGVEHQHVTDQRADRPALHPLPYEHPGAGAESLGMRGIRNSALRLTWAAGCRTSTCAQSALTRSRRLASEVRPPASKEVSPELPLDVN